MSIKSNMSFEEIHFNKLTLRGCLRFWVLVYVYCNLAFVVFEGVEGGIGWRVGGVEARVEG